MNNIKKFLTRLSGLISSSLLVLPVLFAMDVGEKQAIEQDSKKNTETEDSHEYTAEELESLFKKHREEMKLARKKVEKRLSLNRPQSK
jgi:hypothetical protein